MKPFLQSLSAGLLVTAAFGTAVMPATAADNENEGVSLAVQESVFPSEHVYAMRQLFRASVRPDFVQRLNDFDAHRTLAVCNQASTAESTPICAWAAFDSTNKITGKRYEDTPALAMHHFSSFIGLYDPPPEYTAWENERLRAAHDAIESDAYIIAHRYKIKPQSDYKDIDDAREQAGMKSTLLQRTADHIRAAFDLPPIPVILYKIPIIKGKFANTRGWQIKAAYSPGTDLIEIDYEWGENSTDNWGQIINIIGEEVKHSIDAHMAYDLISGTMASDDFRAPHAAAVAINMSNYVVGPAESMLKAQGIDNAHVRQYIERRAKIFADALTQPGKSIPERTAGTSLSPRL